MEIDGKSAGDLKGEDLFRAAESDDSSVFKSLSEEQLSKASRLRNEDGRSLLHVAVSSSNTKVQLILKVPYYWNQPMKAAIECVWFSSCVFLESPTARWIVFALVFRKFSNFQLLFYSDCLAEFGINKLWFFFISSWRWFSLALNSTTNILGDVA